jgi:hypothetical protein
LRDYANRTQANSSDATSHDLFDTYVAGFTLSYLFPGCSDKSDYQADGRTDTQYEDQSFLCIKHDTFLSRACLFLTSLFEKNFPAQGRGDLRRGYG